MRAIIVLAIILGIVVGGLMLLRRTTGSGVPRPGELPRKQIKGPDDEESDDDRRGW